MGAMISRHQAGVEYQKQRGVCGGSYRMGEGGGGDSDVLPLQKGGGGRKCHSHTEGGAQKVLR